MGKMIKNCSIFVLFLLMSISVFAGRGNGKIPPGQAKKEIGVKGSVDVTEYPKIKIILDGNNGNKTILKNEIKETPEWSSSKIANPMGNNKTEVIYMTPLKSKVKPGERVEVKLYIYNGNIKNGNWINTYYTVPELSKPKNIEIKTYEEIYQVEKSKIKKDGYIFTKGGAGSYVEKPAIYVTIPVSEEIKKLKIQKLVNGKFKNKDKNKNKAITSIVSSDDENNVVRVEFDFEEGTNTVKIIPINKDNVKGEPKILDFVVDTKIKNSYLEKEGIIGELEAKEIKIKLSKFEELSGINKYSYTLSNGFQREGKEEAVDGSKYLTPTEDGKLDDVKIQLRNFSEGSRLTLSFSVYDRLGHKKTYEKTYFVPKQSGGITAKVSGDMKQRRSKIKIVTEGNKDKFGIGSSIDGSSEEDDTSISGS